MVGNAFGWSTIIISLAFKYSKIVVIDAGVEGENNSLGIDITNDIIKGNNLNCVVEKGFSPQDTKRFCLKHFVDEKVDFVFVDGLHTNDQIEKDFYGIEEFCNKNAIFLFHDVINWNLKIGFDSILKKKKDYTGKILYRTTSGMGVLIPRNCLPEVLNVLDAFTDTQEYIDHMHSTVSPHGLLSAREKRMAALKGLVSLFLPKRIKDFIKAVVRKVSWG